MRYHSHLTILAVMLWTILIAPNALAINKIIVLTSPTTPAEEVTSMYHGLLAGFGQTYEENKTIYPLEDDYQLELVTYQVGKNPLATYTSEENVIAIICQNSVVCEPAFGKNANKNLLVLSFAGTSTALSSSKNILRLAPSNAVQAKAIYNQLKKDGNSRFAIIYEPTVYAMDLYNAFLSQYFNDIIESAQKPKFVGAFPVSDFIVGLSSQQRGTTTEHVIELLPKLKLDGVAFFGLTKAFLALTDPTKGSDTSLVKNWYASNAVTPLEKGFAGLRAFSLYMPNDGEGAYPEYYYAHDAGTIMKMLMSTYKATIHGIPERERFLELAQKTKLPVESSKTGAKSFSSADDHGRFNVELYDGPNNTPKVEDITVSGN